MNPTTTVSSADSNPGLQKFVAGKKQQVGAYAKIFGEAGTQRLSSAVNALFSLPVRRVGEMQTAIERQIQANFPGRTGESSNQEKAFDQMLRKVWELLSWDDEEDSQYGVSNQVFAPELSEKQRAEIARGVLDYLETLMRGDGVVVGSLDVFRSRLKNIM